jgi:hypothetical protein
VFKIKVIGNEHEKTPSNLAGNYINYIFTTESSEMIGTNFIYSYDLLNIGVDNVKKGYKEFNLSIGIESYQLIICNTILIDLNGLKTKELYTEYHYSLKNMQKRIKNAFDSISYKTPYV